MGMDPDTGNISR